MPTYTRELTKRKADKDASILTAIPVNWKPPNHFKEP